MNYKFKYESDQNVVNECQKLVQKKTEYQKQYVSIPLEVLTQIKSELQEFSIIKMQLEDKKKIIEEMNEKMTISDQKLQTANEQLEKIDQRQLENHKKFSSIFNSKIDSYQKEIEQLKEDNQKLENSLKEKENHIQLRDSQIEHSEKNLIEIQEQNKRYQSEIYNLRQELHKMTQLQKRQPIKADFFSKNAEKKFNIQDVLSVNCIKHHILSFLSASDIINLSQTNKKLYFPIQLDFSLCKILIHNNNKYYLKQLKQMYNQINFFREKTQNLDPSILKVAILKFICRRANIGDYIVQHFNDAQSLFDITYMNQAFQQQTQNLASNQQQTEQQQQQPQEQQKNSSIDIQEYPFLQKYFSKDDAKQKEKSEEVQTVINDLDNIQSNYASTQQQQQQQQQQEKKKEKGFFSSIKSIIKTKTAHNSNIQSTKDTIEQIQVIKTPSKENIDRDNEIIREFDPELQVNKQNLELLKDEQDFQKTQILQEIQQYQLNMSNIINSLEEDPQKMKKFLEKFYFSFINVLSFSHLLFKESKEMQQLQHYLVSMVMEKNKLIEVQQDKYDDLKMIQQADQKMKEYLNQAVKDQGEKILNQEQLIFERNQKIEHNKKELVQSEQSKHSVETNLKEKEQKLQILAREIKQLISTNEKLVHERSKQTKTFNTIFTSLKDLQLFEK